MKVRILVFSMLLVSLVTTGAGAPPVPVQAPAGKCWVFTPSYCYLKEVSCPDTETRDILWFRKKNGQFHQSRINCRRNNFIGAGFSHENDQLE
jgi:hypothetical protein